MTAFKIGDRVTGSTSRMSPAATKVTGTITRIDAFSRSNQGTATIRTDDNRSVEVWSNTLVSAPAPVRTALLGIGTKVRITDTFKNVAKGTEGTVYAVDPGDPLMRYKVNFGFGRVLWCYTKDIEAMAPAFVSAVTAPSAPKGPVRADTSRQHWIIALLSPEGIPLPGTQPMTHDSEDAATKEATRLMEANPGKTFVVYRAAKSFMKPVAAARVTTF